MSKKEAKLISLSWRIEHQGKKVTERTLKEELDKLREEGYDCRPPFEQNDLWFVYCKKTKLG